MHIAIVGNIGAGKTTLSHMLGQHLKWKVLEEDTVDNPYLSHFYNDMQRWAFNLQIYFLKSRFKQNQLIKKSVSESIIQDRTLYEDASIFAKNLHQKKILSDIDYQTYLDLYYTLESEASVPDLLIYLDAPLSKLVGNISKRKRSYESTISIDYLEGLQTLYKEWIDSYDLGKKLVIDTSEIDFVSNKEDFALIVNRITRELFGLFS